MHREKYNQINEKIHHSLGTITPAIVEKIGTNMPSLPQTVGGSNHEQHAVHDRCQVSGPDRRSHEEISGNHLMH